VSETLAMMMTFDWLEVEILKRLIGFEYLAIKA
jgi:hypothetical protein